MKKEYFVMETKLDEKESGGDVDYYYNVYIEKVEPFLELINYWKFSEKMNTDTIRNVLGVSKGEWRTFASMDTLKEYTQKSGDYMKAKIQLDFLKAKDDNQNNAKFHEMGFKRFDKGYGETGEINVNIPDKIDFNIKAAGMSQEDIEKKAKGEIDGDV